MTIIRETAVPFPVIYAGIAQSVEQLIRNEQVAGSSPITSSKRNAQLSGCALLLLQCVKRRGAWTGSSPITNSKAQSTAKGCALLL